MHDLGTSAQFKFDSGVRTGVIDGEPDSCAIAGKLAIGKKPTTMSNESDSIVTCRPRFSAFATMEAKSVGSLLWIWIPTLFPWISTCTGSFVVGKSPF